MGDFSLFIGEIDMSQMSDFLETELLDHVLRNAAYTSPTTVYLALFTAAPSDSGGGTEVSGNAYARQAITFGAPSGGVSSNSAEIQFPIATGSWGTITHVGIFDAATTGNLLFHGALTASKVIGSGDRFTMPATNLSVTLQ
jgi:hypothetical protein